MPEMVLSSSTTRIRPVGFLSEVSIPLINSRCFRALFFDFPLISAAPGTPLVWTGQPPLSTGNVSISRKAPDKIFVYHVNSPHNGGTIYLVPQNEAQLFRHPPRRSGGGGPDVLHPYRTAKSHR